ncbi:MAG: pyruvate:ferredoxin (flavodoxin) oxidoreductase [Spirochaetaceae bacterium]|nr:pyruvate:ferredoxin (flavodoxin) oxidoreductase [Spirochaetaceae bacterium]
MAEKKMVTVDGNSAVAYVAHAVSEIIAIYPITPSSPMAELSDEWSAQGRANVWGFVPTVVEMQSEAGAAASVHGAATSGALTTTFTASQGLLLMIPTMYRLAGELTPSVFHISARALATNGLSIFGDHSDVMAARATGFAMLFGNSVQESADMAAVAHAATLKSRVPFMNIFDGFRTSHEVQKIEEIPYDSLRKIMDREAISLLRAKGLDPEHPSIKGTAQNPDVYFAHRESINNEYAAIPAIVQEAMDKLAAETGRQYKLFDYCGAADAEQVIIVMGSGAEPIEEAIDILNKQGNKYGVLKVRLFRPFSAEHFIKALPTTVKSIAVLDRTKEPGSIGEPLLEDVRTAVSFMAEMDTLPFAVPRIVGGRYGLGSCEFTPAMAKAIYEELKKPSPKHGFTIGITDDKSHTSLTYDTGFKAETAGVHRAMFYGLGSDGTVGANKNSIKIIGERYKYAQGYFVYDSKKAGTVTVSHVRFSDNLIKSPYLIDNAGFIACHKFSFLEKVDMLKNLDKGGTFLLTSHYGADEVWQHIPVEVQQQIIDKEAKFYVIDAGKIAEEAGMGSRINVVMQTAFFKISGILPEAEAVELIKKTIVDTYSRKGEEVVKKNISTIDKALAGVHQVNYPKQTQGNLHMVKLIPDSAPAFIKEVTGEIMLGRGDKIPVSKVPVDGIYPVETTKYDKRNIADKIPVWHEDLCIACGQCSLVCPHAVIRMKAYDKDQLAKAPKTFKHKDMTVGPLKGHTFTVQVAPEDCTACGACLFTCLPTKAAKGEPVALTWGDQVALREDEKENFEFFLTIPETDRSLVPDTTPLGVSIRQPLFEFAGACEGCGETPYIKALSQLFGDRMLIGNATGCSSIYGGNLPTHPYCTREGGQGPAWGNSLFEDTAEYAMGMRLTADGMMTHAKGLLTKVKLDAALVSELTNNPQSNEAEIEKQRANVAKLKAALKSDSSDDAKNLVSVADYLIVKSVWAFGGDGWAYDIGYGGLDHVLASGKNINMLVMDTEVYSNTGGQSSKATPKGAIAKFAASGKGIVKKPLGLMQAMYGYVYVAHISLGASYTQAIKAIKEAEAYNGPSLIIAYSHCVAHGINMMRGMEQGKNIVTSGIWPLYRYNPTLKEQGKNPFVLDAPYAPKEDGKFATKVEDFMYKETRFKSLQAQDPERAKLLLAQFEQDVVRQYKELKYLADRPF